MRPSEALNVVCCEDFDNERPMQTSHTDLVYSPDGYAWASGGVDLALSVRRNVFSVRPVLRTWWERPQLRLEQGTLIQAEHSLTYGDWVSEQLRSLAYAGDFPEPLLLPAEMGRRPYVVADLMRLGIDYRTVDRPMLIKRASVLHKHRYSLFWDDTDVAAYRNLFKIVPPEPRMGSILYLSRLGVRSENTTFERSYPSEILAEIVEELGGRVVLTGGMGFDDFSALASDAETVIADHGAAMFNLLQWHTRNVIEVFSDQWWSYCYVFLGAACGSSNYALVRGTSTTKQDLRAAIEGHLERFESARSHD